MKFFVSKKVGFPLSFPLTYSLSSALHHKLNYHASHRTQISRSATGPSRTNSRFPTTRRPNMCESWLYGCGHIIRTACPRPKPVAPAAILSASGSGSIGSNLSNSTRSSPCHNTTTSTPLLSKFCNGFPLRPKETSSPCYNCILADARLKIAREKPEVDAKKEQLRGGSMARTTARSRDGRYVDEFGNKLMAQENYAPEVDLRGGFGCARPPGPSHGQGRARRFTTAQPNFDGSGSFGRNRYVRGEYGGQDGYGGGDGGDHGGNLPTGCSHSREGHYNGNRNSAIGPLQDKGGQYGGGGSSNGLAARRASYGGQHTSYSHQPGYETGYSQQHFVTDFGGASWGQNRWLGSELDNHMYYQHTGDHSDLDGPHF